MSTSENGTTQGSSVPPIRPPYPSRPSTPGQSEPAVRPRPVNPVRPQSSGPGMPPPPRPAARPSAAQTSAPAQSPRPVTPPPSSGKSGDDGGMMMPPRPPKKKNPIWVIIAIILVLVVGVMAYFIWKSQNDLKEAQALAEQTKLDMEQMQLEQDYEALNAEFAQFENQRTLIMDDSVKRELTEKYETARLQIEKLQQELRDSKQRSAAEIQKLKNEIETLRALLRHYVEEIDRLNQENQALRNENAEIKQRNEDLNTRVVETSRKNEQLTERMILAEKLNVTAPALTALNKKGKNEKKVQKAAQLMFTFTIPQNNSTPVGEKTFYMRILSPSGQLLGNTGTFSFEGASVPFTARKIVEYTGEELSNVTIYYDINTALTPGDYTVELFADNYRLLSRSFNLK